MRLLLRSNALSNNAQSPFLAFVRENGERLQCSYGSINHIMLALPTRQGESCYIYAAGFEVELRGKHLDSLCDALLSASITKISQAATMQEESRPIVTHITWTAMQFNG